ncbi:MAG: response regulator [Deltaproteobacteria bacterium]|nr:response regulator [Deltaproteobacteria bacterium]
MEWQQKKGTMSAPARSVFVIDDEEPLRKVLNTHLTKEGFRVIQSPGGAKVFDLLRTNSYDLVICDIKMPEVDGAEVLDYVRTQFDTIPIIMLTGFTDIAVAIDVMKKGAFDYLMKPVRKDDLMATIRRALVHRDLLVRNKELEAENREYQQFLEQKVRERTKELNVKAMELEGAYGILKNMNVQFVNVLAETIEAKDHYTRGHCNRMRVLCVELGRLAGLHGEEIELLEYASLLHDLGKISVNEAVLNKEGPLSDDEHRHIQRHSEIGEKILIEGIPLMESVARIIGAHHENYDGSGYPRQLKAGEIPVGARIIAVADLFDAMTSDRPYRKGLPTGDVIIEMEKVAGTQLDPEIVRLFIDHRLHLLNGGVRANA